VLASTGVQNSHTTQNGKTTTAMSAKAVRDFAMVLSEKFQIASQKVGNTTVLYYYHNDENFEQSLQTSVDSLKTFSQTFGGYPYTTLSVVQTNFVHGGMEYPCLVYISDALKSYKDYQNVIVHEIAHQWWYGLVGSNQYNNAWQDEGLTDYSTALFYQKNPSYQIDMEEIINTGVKSYHFFTQVYGAVYKQLDTSMNRALNEYENENEYVYIAYVKGMLLFDSLNALIGDKNFFEGLRLYVKTYSYKNAQPYDLIWAFEKASGMHLEGFFDSWIEGKVIVMAS
jgi:aminopeptidase N